MIRIYLLLFFITFCHGAFASGDGFASLQLGPEEKYNISNLTGEYIEGKTNVAPDLAFRLFEAGKFRPLDKTNNEYINDGLINKRGWLSLTVENTRNYESTLVLGFILSGVNSVECYTVDDEQQIRPLLQTKDNEIQVDKSLLAKLITFNLYLQPGEKALLLVHLVNHGQMLYVPAKIYDLRYFIQLNSSKQVSLASFREFSFLSLFSTCCFT